MSETEMFIQDPQEAKWEEIKGKRAEKLKPYAIGHIGEWFMVVFHWTGKKAKRLGWKHYPADKTDENYLALDAKLLDGRYNILAESDEPHVIMEFTSEWENWDEYVDELWGRYLTQYEL